MSDFAQDLEKSYDSSGLVSGSCMFEWWKKWGSKISLNCPFNLSLKYNVLRGVQTASAPPPPPPPNSRIRCLALTLVSSWRMMSDLYLSDFWLSASLVDSSRFRLLMSSNCDLEEKQSPLLVFGSVTDPDPVCHLQTEEDTVHSVQVHGSMVPGYLSSKKCCGSGSG